MTTTREQFIEAFAESLEIADDASVVGGALYDRFMAQPYEGARSSAEDPRLPKFQFGAVTHDEPKYVVVKMSALDQARLIYAEGHVLEVEKDRVLFYLNPDDLRRIGMWNAAEELETAQRERR